MVHSVSDGPLACPLSPAKRIRDCPNIKTAEESDVFILSGAEDLVPLLAIIGGQWKRDSSQRKVNRIDYQSETLVGTGSS
jgi:hypothetical protein